MTDYYEILGVPRDATPEQIKKAYRKLARELHPDVAGNDPASEEKFKDVSRAYDVLGNPDKRRAYDLGGDPSAPGGGFGGGFGFQDIFETFFGAATGTTSQRGPIPRARRGQDALVRLDIELAEATFGTHREVTVDPDALNGLVRAALARIDSRELHRVRLHPDDIPAVQRFLDAAGMPSQVDVLADPSLERGGAVFETTRGTLDASIATQMSEIERGFLDIVRRSHERG